jgi:cysteine dioxygenase
MGQSSAQISLDEFMIEMGREPVSSLTHERLMDLTRRLAISSELIESRTCFAKDHYARNLVCRTPTFELLVLCWRPGHESTIHDHAGSLNAIRVDRDGIRQLANTSDEHLVTVHVYAPPPTDSAGGT